MESFILYNNENLTYIFKNIIGLNGEPVYDKFCKFAYKYSDKDNKYFNKMSHTIFDDEYEVNNTSVKNDIMKNEKLCIKIYEDIKEYDQYLLKSMNVKQLYEFIESI